MDFDILPMLLVLAGSYFLIRLRFFFLLHPIGTLRRGLRVLKDKRAARSFFLALAGTLGVGNVFGVAFGILIGGAGSLFWLVVSMLFAMVIKYCEVVLTSDNLSHDGETHGGFYYVISHSFKHLSRPLSALYALTVLLLSLVMGAALQSDAVVETALTLGAIPRSYIAVVLLTLTLLAIVGGARKIETITAFIIPLSTIIYIFMTLSIIFVNLSALPLVFEDILSSALSIDSVLGGGIGFLMLRPIKEGFARGLLSNEAGAGTSAIAHARSGVLSPSSAGILGILEVWFDTGVICVLTGLSILVSVPDISAFSEGMELVMYSVGNLFGGFGKVVALLCVFAFAFATVICWYYYGSQSWCSLFGRRRRLIFLALFLSAVFFGCFLDSILLVGITDILMLTATVLTLSALIKNSDRIRALSESGGLINLNVKRLRPYRFKGNVFSRAGKRR